MKNLNRKGFTLIEVLAVIVLIAVIGGIAIPNVLSTINTSKNISEKNMISNIKTASQQLYEEVDNGATLYHYDENGTKQTDKIEINSNSITINLQTLVSNGLLSGVGKENNEKGKIIINPKTNENIGSCQIKITKVVDNDYKTEYIITKEGIDSKCPTYD